jgi:hypothetical protein
MAIDFPNAPTLNQVFTSGGQSWTWDGAKWVASGLAGAPYVPQAGYVPAMNDNRIINGDMRIDQRWNGASGTANSYTVDRWFFNSSQASKITWSRNLNTVTGPVSAGFPYCLGFQSSSAYTLLAGDIFYFQQSIEADMVSDFAWGTTGAQPVTLSFWAYSNQTGTFGGCISNFAGTRGYPFTYSISSANTWTKITVAIPSDPTGTWVMSGNAASMSLRFDLGSGATFRAPAGAWANGNFIGANGAVSIVSINTAALLLTGVKLEIGAIATSYNRQSLAKSMADCQRYFVGLGSGPFVSLNVQGYSPGASFNTYVQWSAPVTMRAAPTISSGWGSGVNAAVGAATALTDNRTIQSYVQGLAAGAYSAVLVLTSLSAEL